MSGRVILDIRSGVAWLILEHTQRRNAVTPTMLRDLRMHLQAIWDDPSVRCVALTGDGDKAFCAGYDLRSFGELSLSAAEAQDDLGVTLKALAGIPKPTVAVLNGHAVGAGCELAVTCDIRWAKSGVTMGMPPAKLGLVYAPEGVARFLALLGPAHTAELFYGARNLEAVRCAAIGLVNEVWEADAFLPTCESRLAEIAALAPISHAGHALLIRGLSHLRLAESEQATIEALRAKAFASDDAAEGVAAFMEKRKPRFKGH
jgi:enoyl-CoA hydratase